MSATSFGAITIADIAELDHRPLSFAATSRGLHLPGEFLKRASLTKKPEDPAALRGRLGLLKHLRLRAKTQHALAIQIYKEAPSWEKLRRHHALDKMRICDVMKAWVARIKDIDEEIVVAEFRTEQIAIRKRRNVDA